MNSRWITLHHHSARFPVHVQKSQMSGFFKNPEHDYTTVLTPAGPLFARETPEEIVELLRVRRS